MNVVDNTRDHRFELTVDSELAVSGYRLSGNVITFTHTGRGTYRSNLRTLMLQAAAARARGLHWRLLNSRAVPPHART